MTRQVVEINFILLCCEPANRKLTRSILRLLYYQKFERIVAELVYRSFKSRKIGKAIYFFVEVQKDRQAYIHVVRFGRLAWLGVVIFDVKKKTEYWQTSSGVLIFDEDFV